MKPYTTKQLNVIKSFYGWSSIRIDPKTKYVYYRQLGRPGWRFVADSQAQLIERADLDMKRSAF